MSKSIKKNYIYNTAYQILSLITPLITTPYVSRVLGAKGIGEFSFSSSIVSYFAMFAALGTAIYGQREISYLQTNREKRTQVFGEVVCMRLCSTIICLVLYIGFLAFTGFSMIYLIQIFTLLSVITDISWLLQGMEEFGKTVFRNVVFKILNIAFILIAVQKEEDLLLYIFGICFLQFLSTVSLWAYLPRFVNRPTLRTLRPFSHFKLIFTLFLPTIAIQIYTVLDKTMIGVFAVSAVENGYYEQALKLSKMVLTIVTSLGTVMIPRIGHYFSLGDYDKVRSYMYRGYSFVWFLGIPLCFGVVGTASNIVPWFYGAGFEKVIPLLSILAFLILAIGISNVTGMQYMIPTQRQNLFTLTVCIGAGINFFLNLLLIPRFYSIGAAIASVTAETAITLIQFYIVRKEFSIGKVLKLSKNYWIAGVGMLVLLLWEGNRLPATILHTIFMIFTGAIFYYIVLLILRDEFFISNMKHILEPIGKRLPRK